MLAVSVRPIETFYPDGRLVTATPGRRLASSLLEVTLAILTLGVGWFVWYLIVVGRGQSPAKQLLGMYIMRADGSRAGGWYTVLREHVVKGLLFNLLLLLITIGIAPIVGALWCLWDREHQCLWDKVTGTFVAYSPSGFRPLTAAQSRMQALAPPPSLASPAMSTNALPAPSTTHEPDPVALLLDLQQLRDEGLITEEQFGERRVRIVDEL